MPQMNRMNAHNDYHDDNMINVVLNISVVVLSVTFMCFISQCVSVGLL